MNENNFYSTMYIAYVPRTHSAIRDLSTFDFPRQVLHLCFKLCLLVLEELFLRAGTVHIEGVGVRILKGVTALFQHIRCRQEVLPIYPCPLARGHLLLDPSSYASQSVFFEAQALGVVVPLWRSRTQFQRISARYD